MYNRRQASSQRSLNTARPLAYSIIHPSMPESSYSCKSSPQSCLEQTASQRVGAPMRMVHVPRLVANWLSENEGDALPVQLRGRSLTLWQSLNVAV